MAQGHALSGEAYDTAELLRRGVSLVGCSGSQFAAHMVDAWLDGAVDALAGSGGDAADGLRVARLSLIDGAALSWLRRPLLLSMRMSVPRERHNSFLPWFGDSTVPRRQLRMDNRFLGYVCLVDRGVVRWHVHGNEVPDSGAVSALAQLTATALKGAAVR